MRRSLLAPPSPVVQPLTPSEGAEHRRPPAGSLVRSSMGEPSPAPLSSRRFFDPVSGWFRRIERATSLTLSRSVYPRVPGATQPYSLQLRRQLTVSEAEVRIRALPPSFEGTTVLLITDIHMGPFLAPRALRSALDRLLTLEPDLILLGGDLATSRLAEVPAHLPALRSLRAPLGVFAVLGNHDHYTRVPRRLRGFLEDCGIRALHNDAVVVERESGRLILAGIDDLCAGEPDLDRALEAGNRLGKRAPAILLSHNPDVFPEASRRGVGLVLSGHTHGGQIRMPGLPVLVRMSRYRLDEGRFSLGGSELVVSRGLGVCGIPLRLACPPEAVLLTLTSTALTPLESGIGRHRRLSAHPFRNGGDEPL